MLGPPVGSKGAIIAPFGLAALLFILTPASVGHQDLGALSRQQPQLAARWGQQLIASPLQLIRDGIFILPEPIGMAMPEPPKVRLASLDPGDLVGSIPPTS